MLRQPHKKTDDDDDNKDMINIYSLYKTHHLKQSNRINIYHKILNKVHSKIKLMSQYDKTETYYIIPEYQFGIPLYNQIACICFVILKLRKNGFKITYTHPNFLWISWKHFIDKYKYTPTTTTTKNNKKYDPEYKFVDKTKQIKSIKNHYKNLNEKLISNSNDPLLKYTDNDNKGNKNVLDSLNYRASLLKKFNN